MIPQKCKRSLLSPSCCEFPLILTGCHTQTTVDIKTRSCTVNESVTFPIVKRLKDHYQSRSEIFCSDCFGCQLTRGSVTCGAGTTGREKWCACPSYIVLTDNECVCSSLPVVYCLWVFEFLGKPCEPSQKHGNTKHEIAWQTMS